jgi:hypothetical protein
MIELQNQINVQSAIKQQSSRQHDITIKHSTHLRRIRSLSQQNDARSHSIWIHHGGVWLCNVVCRRGRGEFYDRGGWTAADFEKKNVVYRRAAGEMRDEVGM